MSFFRKIVFFWMIMLVSPIALFAQVMFVTIFPNTEDDPNLEYVELINTGCNPVDIGGYMLADKVKTYTLPRSTMIDSRVSYRIGRPISKIELNNTNESLTLSDASGNIVHTFSYPTSVKGGIITVPNVVFDICSTETMNPDTGSGTEIQPPIVSEGASSGTLAASGSDTGGQSSGSGALTDSGGSISPTTLTGSGGESTDTGSTDTGSTDTGSTDTGTSLPHTDPVDSNSVNHTGVTQAYNLLGKSGSLEPQILLYDDSDDNGYIDTLEILYDVLLTGSIDTSRVQLYSVTGGLYEDRINTETGYILDYSIEDNILKLDIVESDFQKTTLSINNTTQSELRLKFSNTSLYSFSGELLPDITLTSSFDSYHHVYDRDTYDAINTSSGTIHANTGQTYSGMVTTVSVDFPEIIPAIQNYTNTTLSGEAFVCRETPCRLNMNFESIFNSRFSAGDYNCRVVYGGITENKCNPAQWTPTGTGEIEFTLIHKQSGLIQTKKFPILWDIIPTGVVTHTTTNTIDRIIRPAVPRANISLNGNLSRTQIYSGSVLYCLSETCSVNLDSSDSIVTSGGRYSYLWTSSGRILSEKKNPPEFQFSTGIHTVDLSITDAYGQSSHAQYHIIVGASEKSGEFLGAQKNIFAASIERSEKTKKSKIEAFLPPMLILDNPGNNAYIMDGKYICISPNKTCSLNFSLTGTTRGVEYHWLYSHEGTEIITSNPRSRSFSPGEYTLTLSAFRSDETEPIWIGKYSIKITQQKEKKSKKKITKVSTPKKSPKKVQMPDSGKETIDLVTSAYADDNSNNRSIDTSMIFILFVSVVLNIFFIRRKRT